MLLIKLINKVNNVVWYIVNKAVTKSALSLFFLENMPLAVDTVTAVSPKLKVILNIQSGSTLLQFVGNYRTLSSG